MFNVLYEGHPSPTGPALTNDLCGQNVKVNVNVNVKTALILTF
jgi:hypothetical protein